MPVTRRTDEQSSENAVLAADETVFDFLLVNVLEDMRRVDEDAQRSADGHGKEDVELKTINYHRDVSPVIKNLRTFT